MNLFYQADLFESYLKGSNTAIQEIIDLEKPHIYDFIARMTGNIDASFSHTNEVIKIASMKPKRWQSLNDLRSFLYTTAKKVSEKDWSTETKPIDHPMIDQILQNPNSKELMKKKAESYKDISTNLSDLSCEEREILLLHLRFLFTFSDISTITRQHRDAIEKKYAQTVKKIIGKMPSLPNLRGALAGLESLPISDPKDRPQDQPTTNEAMALDFKKNLNLNPLSNKNTPPIKRDQFKAGTNETPEQEKPQFGDPNDPGNLKNNNQNDATNLSDIMGGISKQESSASILNFLQQFLFFVFIMLVLAIIVLAFKPEWSKQFKKLIIF